MTEETPLKDYGSFSHAPVGEDEIEGHHTDKWQQHAMYVGLHFPSGHGGKRHRRRHKHKKHDDHHNSEPTKASTPPSQRVQFILGTAGEAEDTEHETHEMFCEMEELRGVGDDMEWKETARWIKFEEDVEEGGERWSKPFVATLALHSLFELRRGIMTGTIMLDLDASNLQQITELVIDNMIASKQMEDSQKERVSEVLLSRHRHQHDKSHSTHGSSKGLPIIRSLAEIGRKASKSRVESEGEPEEGVVHWAFYHLPRRMSNAALNLASHFHRADMPTADSSGHLTPGKSGTSIGRKGSSKDLEANGSSSDMHSESQVKFNEHFAKKIPEGAEASNILVGEVDFLNNPIIAFVRLTKAQLLGDLTEVAVPTRFIFILLGPTGNQQRYHEIGRSIATLMSDSVFHDVAYKAKNRGDLLAGIDEFLDQVTVLPPGEWDPTIRIEPPKSVPSQEGRKTPGSSGGQGLPNGNAHVEEEEEHGDPTLVKTGRLFGGLVNDLKRKAPFYLSDFKDALHVQCVASVFFMYFACLTPIITFGGLLGSATDNNMAAMESLLAGAVCGISFHLFAGQPLTIIGSTGPILVFETIMYNFASDFGMNYLGLRFWVGLWVCLILLIMVAFDLSALVRYITRFTEESFAALIALIFIVEAFKKLFHILDHDAVNLNPEVPLDYSCNCTPPVNFTGNPNITYNFNNMTGEDCVELGGEALPGCFTPHYVPDVFFFSCLLFLGTFTLAYTLKMCRTGRFFPSFVRSIISDFAVMIAIVTMVGVDAGVGLPTPKLTVPQDFKPTRPDRGWVVMPILDPWWIVLAAIAPALLATILIFMDQQITAVIVNRKENKLKKGNGYHLDLFLIAIQIGMCSVLGIPWFVAATVLSINHVRSLTLETESAAPGEKPRFLGVREQRVTGIIVFLLCGLSVLMVPVLMLIPMPVLYGVFLFMGVSSLNGVQLVQRIMIVFMPPKYQPDYMFLRHVPLRRVHYFTIIQVLCLTTLWVIKTIKSISIIFPLMVLAMCFIRKLLDYFFSRHELKWLDDIMPESHKREKEDQKKEAEETEALGSSQVIEMTGGAVNIPLKDGKSIKVPVDRITYCPDTKEVNISDEMSNTAIWKQLVANESNPNFQAGAEAGVRQRKKRRKSSKKRDDDRHKKKEPVKFSIAEEETEHLMAAPEIVVDPPSKASSPTSETQDETTNV